MAKALAAGVTVKTIFERLDQAQADRIRRLYGRGPVQSQPATVAKPAATPVDAGRTVVRRRSHAAEEGAPEPHREAPAPVQPVAVPAPAPVAVAVAVQAPEPTPAAEHIAVERAPEPVEPTPAPVPEPVKVVAPAAPLPTPEPAAPFAPATNAANFVDNRPRIRRVKMEDVPTPPELQPRAAASAEEVRIANKETADMAARAEAAAALEARAAFVPVEQPARASDPTPAVAVRGQERAPEIALNEIGAAIQRDAGGPSKVPRLNRMKMPDYLVNIPKPVVKPVVEEPAPRAPVAPVAPAGAESAADRGGPGRPGERGAPVDDRGGRGRKVIYDRRRDSSATADGGRARGKKRGKAAKMTAVPSAAMSQQKRNLKIEDTITVANLAHQMAVKGNEVIRKLFDLGIMATVNHPLDLETAELIAQEFGYTVENVGFDLESYLQKPDEKRPANEQQRPPVVTVMGHVDHGKTSLLDAIRKTHTASREAGGITQHIGAYTAEVEGKGKVVFLDTPGHEAFTAMRARGAKATDVIVLVVAADDGVMPQTIEAINHGKAAKVPIIVAVNKIDKPGADIEKVRRELAEQGVMAEEWGGDAIFCEVSAKTGKGIDKLLEMLVLQSEVLDLKADPDADGRGLVIESRLERGRGPVATLLVQTGTLKKGQFVVSGAQYAKVRAMQDDAGRPIELAGPSTPVEVIGFDTVTNAGDEFYVVADEKKAKAIVEHRTEKQREKELLKTSKRTLEDMFAGAGQELQRELNLIIKADVHGSAEALKQALSKIEHEEVKVRVLHAAVGGVTESDIHLASASKAVIIAFNVKPEAKGKRLAVDLNVPIKQYSVIYDAIDEVTNLLEGMLTPIIEEHILGHAEVRELFSVPKLGTIAGCSVLDGSIVRSARMRLFRGKDQVWEGEIASLKRFKDDVKEVTIGYECGIGLQGFNKLIVGDRLECFELKKIARKLKPEGQGGSRPAASPA